MNFSIKKRGEEEGLELKIGSYTLSRISGTSIKSGVYLKGPNHERGTLFGADETVSREHLRINTSESGVTLTDKKSRNGTYVNEERIEEETLTEGEYEIRVGMNTLFELLIS